MLATHSPCQYKPIYKPNQVICGTGQTVIVTGWTVKESIAKRLEPHEYGAIGNLYSPTRGVNFLIRNLIANPHIRFVIVLNATKADKNAGGVQCLLDFFNHGFCLSLTESSRECWAITSEVFGYVDIEIEKESLGRLRRSVVCTEVNSIERAVSLAKNLALADALEPWGEPLYFPMAAIEAKRLPGPIYGHRVEGKTIAETWVKIIQRIKTTGVIRPTQYDGKWQELIDLIAVVTDEPVDFYFPEPSYLPIDRSFLGEYISQILNDAPYKEGVKYTYGQRLRSWFKVDQIEQVIQKLIGEIDAASAVMSLWDVDDHNHGGSPCLNHIWIRVVDGSLSLTATFRSNDMFSAWVANAMGLRALQQHIRDEIASRSTYDLKMGPLITVSQSAHIYDDCWENADKLIAKQYTAICKRRNYDDPSGNFLIEIDGQTGAIVVTQTTPGSGEEVYRFFSKDPLEMLREICTSSPAIQPEHSGYLGIELQKAWQCLKDSRGYIQDRLCDCTNLDRKNS